MFRVPSLQVPHAGLAFHLPYVSALPSSVQKSSCAFLNEERYKSVIRTILGNEAYLIEGFFDFNASSLTSSSSIVWRADLPLMNQDVILAYAIARGFLAESEMKIQPHDFIAICQYIQEVPSVHKSFEFIFMHCPFFQALKDGELIKFYESQIAKREKDDHHYKQAREGVSLNLLTYLCFFPRDTLASEDIDDLWALAINSKRDMTDVDIMKCERLFQLRASYDSELLGVLGTLKESYLIVKNIVFDPASRYFIPFESERKIAAEAYLEVVSELPTSIYNQARLIDGYQSRQNLESSDGDLTLTMSLDLPVNSELLDEQLAREIDLEEHQKEAMKIEQLRQDEEVAKALQTELDQEPPLDNMRLFRPILNVLKSIFHAEVPPKEPEDPSLLKTYDPEKLEAFIQSILADKTYLQNESDDVLDSKDYVYSLAQLKAYYAIEAYVPEILGHFTKAQVLTVFRLSESHASPLEKVEMLFQEWNDGKAELPAFLREILLSIEGYGIYKEDKYLIDILMKLFQALSFEHVKSIPNVLIEKEKTSSSLYYLIRVAALECIFE